MDHNTNPLGYNSSALTNFFNNNGEENVKLTNKHTTSKQPRKKRKVNVRACDACAVRKVKCENTRPCSHCVSNNISCTSNRERKKSGPKTLTKKTLDSINSLTEVIENNGFSKRPSISNYGSKSPSVELESSSNNSPGSHRSASITQSNITPLEESRQLSMDSNEYIVTPFNLVENLNLIDQEPAIHQLIKPLSVNHIILNYRKLIDFLNINYPDSQHLEINLINHHDDSLFLSTLLIILTLNQIIAELLIKLKKQKFKSFQKYPKKFLMFRGFKNFKNLCHFKVLEIFTLIEKNFIVPPIIPPNRIKQQHQQLNSFLHLNHYQIYYNLSLSCLQLCNYYHILNLTNTLNSSNPTITNYGNEAQEHQKILYLHRAITYFQLINLKEIHHFDLLQELYEFIYTFERYYIIFSSHNYNINISRNNQILLHVKFDKFKSSNDVFYQMMEICDEFGIVEELCYNTNFNTDLNYNSPKNGYFEIKSKICNLTTENSIYTILLNILLFKILLIRPLDFNNSKKELVKIITNINEILNNETNSDIFKVRISNYQILQPMLHLLKIFFDIKQVEVKLNKYFKDEEELLIQFSDNLISHFPFFNNINKLIRAYKMLNNWFLNLSELRKEVESEPQVPENYPQSVMGLSTVNFPSIPSQQRIASMISINDLLKDIDTNATLPPDQMIMNTQMNYQPDDESDEEDKGFSIKPQQEHGHKFVNNQHHQVPSSQELTLSIPTPINLEQGLTMSASTKSFLRLFNQQFDETGMNHNNTSANNNQNNNNNSGNSNSVVGSNLGFF